MSKEVAALKSGDPGGRGGGIRLRPNFRYLVVAALVALLLMAGTFVLGLTIRMGDQAAYENSQQQVTALATVESRVESPLTLSGLTGVGARVSVKAFTPQGASVAQITTASPAGGSLVQPGSVIVAISDRPVFAMPLDGPWYRDVSLHDSGPDVRALNSALSSLGFDDLDDEDEYTWSTVDAIAELYDSHGYAAHRADLDATEPVASSAPSDPSAVPGAVVPQAPGAAVPQAPVAAAPQAAPAQMPRGSRMPFVELVSVPQSGMLVLQPAAALQVLAADAEAVVLSSAVSRVVARIDAHALQRVTVGQAVTIIVQGSGQQAAGTVGGIGDFVAVSEAESGEEKVPGYDVTVEIASEFVGTLGDNQAVQLTFLTEQVQGTAVPATALSQSGKKTSVWRQGEPGEFEEIAVEVQKISDGWAFLAEGSGLMVGDKVRLG